MVFKTKNCWISLSIVYLIMIVLGYFIGGDTIMNIQHTFFLLLGYLILHVELLVEYGLKIEIIKIKEI